MITRSKSPPFNSLNILLHHRDQRLPRAITMALAMTTQGVMTDRPLSLRGVLESTTKQSLFSVLLELPYDCAQGTGDCHVALLLAMTDIGGNDRPFSVIARKGVVLTKQSLFVVLLELPYDCTLLFVIARKGETLTKQSLFVVLVEPPID